MEHFPPKRELDVAFVSEIIGQPVRSFSVSEGAKQGDNFIGKMLALKVETEDGGNLDVVVKSRLPLTGNLDEEAIGQSKFYEALEVFATEILFYQKVRPLLQSVTGYSCNKPKIFSSCDDASTNAYIALEDLRPQGYSMANKRIGLTLHQVQTVLKKLAELHVHSYVLLSQEDPTMQELLNSAINGHIWLRHIPGFDQGIFYNTIIKKMMEIMREVGEAETASKMERFVEIGYKTMVDLWEKRGKSPKYFQVVLHGDLWTNNVLFKYKPDGETVEDLAFIDFQQCRFGTIYEDLLYFLFTSTTADFRKQHLKTSLQTYFKEFEGALARLETSVSMPQGFTEEQLVATFYENLEYGFVYEVVGIPFQLSEGVKGPSDEGQVEAPHTSPKHEELALKMCEGMKLGAKNSPIAVQRLKELCAEMIKLNILS